MSVEKGPSGARSITVEREVPGTPDDVWEAIATGPGISSWFYPTDVEQRPGGVLTYHTGSQMDVPAKVTVWDPPRRFRHEGRDCGPDGPPTATEWTITPRSGGRCVVRIVHSLFASGKDWDDQLENFEAGWPAALSILRLYLAHFGGQRASILRAMAPFDGSAGDAWKALVSALGAGRLAPGDPWSFSAPDASALKGDFVESAGRRQPYAVFRLREPAPGIAIASAYKVAEQATVTLEIYFYGEGAPEVATRDAVAWQAWFAARFP